jgi:hypothetical protein
MRILLLDIETRPAELLGWGLRDQTFSLAQLRHPGGMICFGAQWYGQKNTMFFSEYQEGGHRAMCEAAFELMSEADAIVHFNGTSFDIKHLYWEFQQYKLGVPAPHIDIDLCKTTRQRFRPISGKLQHIVDRLNIGHKVSHSGFPLWVGWLDGDEKSIKLMEKYCKQDVKLLVPLYEALRPWIHNHPNVALHDDLEGLRCNKCGSDDLEKRGFSYTPTAKRQRFQCRNCGGWLTSGKAVSRVDLRGTK